MSRVSLRGPQCTHGVLGISYEEVRDKINDLKIQYYIVGPIDWEWCPQFMKIVQHDIYHRSAIKLYLWSM